MSLRRALHHWLAKPGWNRLARGVLKPLAPLIPRPLLHRVPLVGTADVALPDGRHMRLTSSGDDNLAAMLSWSGWRSFEPETLAVWLALLPECRVVFDVGAYVGIFAMSAAIGAPERDVHAFEPVPESFSRLSENLRANALTGVHAVRAAVGESDGEITLHVPDGVWLPSHSSTHADFRSGTRPLRVPALTLDRYARDHHIARVDLMKIDTEGSEDEVLAGASVLFERSRPFVVCEVLKGLTEEKLNAWFASKRYRFYRLEASGPRAFARIEGDATYRARNFLFAPEERAESALARFHSR
jgi:FkbM family methyltransferase